MQDRGLTLPVFFQLLSEKSKKIFKFAIVKKYVVILTVLSLALSYACTARSAGNNGGDAVSSAVKEAAEQNQVPDFNADSAYLFLKSQLDFGPRNPGSKGNRECAEYLVNTLRRLGADTVITHTPEINIPYAGKTRICNILGRFSPNNPNRILLIAHWDTRPVADEDPNVNRQDKPIPGANDGASGVAVLLETARILAGNPGNKVGVDILLVDAEDSGTHTDDSSWCLGTQAWIEKYPNGVPGTFAPRFGILLDMVGGKGAKFHREMFSDSFAPQVVNAVWANAAQAGYASVFVNERGNAINDDHIPLNKAGIPTIDIIENKSDANGSFSPTWHTHEDNLSNISRQTLKAAGQTVLQTIYTQK